MLQKLTKKDYAVSTWSGGTTTQLAIWPPEAKYADRDFLWRISSATVDLEESDFTPLPDYDRLISTLEGDIVLTHNGGVPLTFRPLEVHAFSGADATHSRGRCRDFNLMLRRGKVAGTMEALRLSDTQTNLNVGTSIACPPPASACSAGDLPTDPAHVGTTVACPPFPAAEQVLLCCVEGEAKASPLCHSERSAAESKNPFPSSPTFTLAPGEALLLTDPVSLTLTGPAVLMVCRMMIL